MQRIKCFFLALLIMLITSAGAQTVDDLQQDYIDHMHQADDYYKVNMFAEAVEELLQAYDIAKQNDWKEKRLKTAIFLGEIYRKTKGFDTGLDFLLKQPYSVDYPELHVRKLGRMAALFTEGARPPIPTMDIRRDSVLKYIDSALKIAEPLKMVRELASLYNEKGFVYGDVNEDSTYFYLTKSIDLFRKVGDTQNYVGAQTNMLRFHETRGDSIAMKPIIDELHQLTKGKQWYSTLMEFYSLCASYYQLLGDTNKINYWRMRQNQNAVLYNVSAGSQQLQAYKVVYETQKYQDEILQTELLLEEKDTQKKQLVVSIVILGLMLMGIIFLLLREYALKKEVDKVNDRYHMLLVESNHRIKNNLQMIISMLQFSSHNLKSEDSIIFRRISGKIHTISTLHKHLYLDLHNEKVIMANYFEDIFGLYKNISSKVFDFEKDMDESIKIGSEQIVYFGLILNEMLSNSYEHCQSEEKTIHIKLTKHKQKCTFEYWDNSHFKSNHQKGTGINLIEQLVKRVEGSDFQMDTTKGHYQFKFYV